MPSQAVAEDSNLLRIQGSSEKIFSLVQIIFRVSAAAFTLGSIAVMVTSTKTFNMLGLTMVVHYSDTASMRFLFAVDIITCIFSVLSLLCVFLPNRSMWNLRNYYFLFIHDMVIMLLLTSGCSAGLAIGYVSKFGEPKAAWLAVCDNVQEFCNHVTISMVLSFLAFVCFLILTVMSSKKLISRPLK